MLINLSNHPLNNWEKLQLNSAKKQFGNIIDLPFPPINPLSQSTDIQLLAQDYFHKITSIFEQETNEAKLNAVHIQGEFTFVFNLVNLLKQSGITCVASTSKRNVESMENGEKVVKFKFVQFREY